MDLDIVLLWLALFSAVLLLANQRGMLWSAKALALICTAAALVLRAPLAVGWAVAAGWLALIGAPTLLAALASRLTLAQRYRLAHAVGTVAMLVHPDRRFRAQRRLVGALAAAQSGGFETAIAELEALRAEPGTPPDVAMTALMHARRLEGRWDAFLAEARWADVDPEVALLCRTRALAALGRTADLLALSRRMPAPPGSVEAALGLMHVFTACGEVRGVQALLRRSLRGLGAPTRALQVALASLAAGLDEARAMDLLARLEHGRDRDVARTAAQARSCPPIRVALDAAQRGYIDGIAAELVADSAPAKWLPRARVTALLVGINVAAFATETLDGGSESVETLRRLGALWPSVVLDHGQWWHGQWWRLGSALFLHYGWVHLAVNMLSLAVVGAAAERSFGGWRMLAIYLASGLGSMAIVVATAVLGIAPAEFVVGASGAIMGLIGGLLAVTIAAWRRSRSRAMLARAAWVAGAIVLQSALDLATPQISFTGHISGVALGLLIGLVLMPRHAFIVADRRPLRAASRGMRPRPSPGALAITLFGAVLALATSLVLPGLRESGDQDPPVSAAAPPSSPGQPPAQ